MSHPHPIRGESDPPTPHPLEIDVSPHQPPTKSQSFKWQIHVADKMVASWNSRTVKQPMAWALPMALPCPGSLPQLQCHFNQASITLGTQSEKSLQVVVENTENTASSNWGYILLFKLNLTLKVKLNQTSKTTGTLTKVFCACGPNLVIPAWTGQACDWYIDAHADGQRDASNDKTQRPKLASDKKKCVRYSGLLSDGTKPLFGRPSL